MTEVNPSSFIDCDAANATVAFTVVADITRGPYEVVMYGTITGDQGDVVIGAGVGNGTYARQVKLTDLPRFTYGATVRFTDGIESSTGAPITVTSECTVPTTVPQPTTTAPQPTTTVGTVPQPTSTTVYYCPSRPEEPPIAGCVHPTSPPSIPGRVSNDTEIGTATSIVNTPSTLPVTGAADAAVLVPAAFALLVLGAVLVWAGRFRRPNGNGGHK